MHAVVIEVSVDPSQAAGGQRELQEVVVPSVRSQPGFVASYWMGADADGKGLTVVVFDSEEAAQRGAEGARGAALPAGVTLESVETRVVVAHA